MSIDRPPAESHLIEDRIGAAVAALKHVESTSEKIETLLPFGMVVWRIWGAESSPELVLLHGGSGSWGHWIANVLALSQKYRVIVPDIPGFGDSALSPKPQSSDGIANALRAGLDQILKGDRFHLAGFSFGAMIAGHLAACERRVATLALVGSVGLGVARNARPPLLRVYREWPAAERWAHQARNLAMLMIHDAALIDDVAIHLQDINVARARLKSSDLSSQETLRGTLAMLNVPVAAVWGENDSIYSGRSMAERKAGIMGLPQGEAADLISHGGHWIAYECPEVFNHWLLTWLDEHPLG